MKCGCGSVNRAILGLSRFARVRARAKRHLEFGLREALFASGASSVRDGDRRAREKKESLPSSLVREMNYEMLFAEQIFLTFHLSAQTETGRSPSRWYRALAKGLSA